MSYVLVSLVGDSATEVVDEFARWFEREFPPAASFHEAVPDHNTVADAVRETPQALVFGHDGGGSLRAAAQGEPWADADQFARVFANAWVWVCACNTRGLKLVDDLESFGRRAHQAGVKVFAGHCAATGLAPTGGGLSDPHNYHRNGLAKAFRAFLKGECRRGELGRLALAGRGRGPAFGALWLEQDMKSLRVLVC